jgi:hypothetical protein
VWTKLSPQIPDHIVFGSVSYLDLLANDSPGPDAGEPLRITFVAQCTKRMIVNHGMSLAYKPNTGYIGFDSFICIIGDRNNGTATGTVNKTVNPLKA